MKRILFFFTALLSLASPTLAQDDDDMPAPAAKGSSKPQPTVDVASYMLDNLRPPAQKSRKSPAEVTVIVKFMVDEFGDVKELKVTKSSGYKELDEDVANTVETMPKWNPATRGGRPVKAYQTLPVRVRLEPAEGDDEANEEKQERIRERKEKKQEEKEEREERSKERKEKKEQDEDDDE